MCYSYLNRIFFNLRWFLNLKFDLNKRLGLNILRSGILFIFNRSLALFQHKCMVWHTCTSHITTLHVASRCILRLIYCSSNMKFVFISYQHIHFVIRMQMSLLSSTIISVLFLPFVNFYNCMMYVIHWRTLIRVYYHVLPFYFSEIYIFFIYF